MCLFSPKSKGATQCTKTSTCVTNTNLNSSGNAGPSAVAGGNASISTSTRSCTNVCEFITTISTCGCVAKAAIECSTALAGGSIRTIACLAKSLSLDLSDGENEENARLTCFASCMVRSDQKFASQSICAVARLACQSDSAIACLEAKQTASNNTLLSAVAGTLSGIATANDTTQASQSTAFATTALKYGVIAVLGLGAIFVIYAASKSK
jgi:hypothetical protein